MKILALSQNRNEYSHFKNFNNSYNNLKADLLNTNNNAINFKGTCFSKQNKVIGKKIFDAIKNRMNNRFVILIHKNSDIDAIGSALGMSRLIEKMRGKTVDIFVEKNLQPNHKFIDTLGKIQVINENRTVESLINQYGVYDGAISIDTAKTELHNQNLYNAFFKTAKNFTADIDHHAKSDGEFAKYTLVDTSKKSASQLVLEFFKSFGIKDKKITAELSDPITAGIIGDTDSFKYTTEEVFSDTNILSKASDISKLITSINAKTPEELELCSKILKKIKFSKDGEIAHFIFDFKGKTEYPEKIIGMAISEMSKLNGVKYYYGIFKDSAKAQKTINASIRSNDKAINTVISAIGGGGHEKACGIHKSSSETTPRKMSKVIFNSLTSLIDNA